MNNTQLNSANSYNVKNIIFSEPQVGTIPDSKPAINYKRVNIQTRNMDGTIGDLIIPTERLFSFGVSENVSMDSGAVNGYVMPLCLWNRDNPTENEKKWTDVFNSIVDRCKKYLLDNRDELEQYELDERDLKKFNPLYWKREKGKIVQGVGPVLYAKLLISKKQGIKILTSFYNKNGENVNGEDLMGKYCYARGAVKIESIFIGNKISLQIKLYEAEVEPLESGPRRLLRSSRNLLSASNNHTEPTLNTTPPSNEEDEEELSEIEPEPTPIKKPKRVLKVKSVKGVKKPQ
jgi:hypothetical protein